METPLVCTYFAADCCKYIVLVYKENPVSELPINNGSVAMFIKQGIEFNSSL